MAGTHLDKQLPTLIAAARTRHWSDAIHSAFALPKRLRVTTFGCLCRSGPHQKTLPQGSVSVCMRDSESEHNEVLTASGGPHRSLHNVWSWPPPYRSCIRWQRGLGGLHTPEFNISTAMLYTSAGPLTFERKQMCRATYCGKSLSCRHRRRVLHYAHCVGRHESASAAVRPIRALRDSHVSAKWQMQRAGGPGSRHVALDRHAGVGLHQWEQTSDMHVSQAQRVSSGRGV